MNIANPSRSSVPVSVVIPTFNRASLVREAILSVVHQKIVKPLEIIVIDDGSTDDTESVVRSIRGDIVYIYQNNQGVSAARNVGICVSKGEWIAFLDSDDLWLPHKLYYHWNYCVNNPGIFISQTDEVWLRNGVRLNPKKYHKKPEGYCFERLLERCLISPSAVMIHQSVFEKVGLFNELLPACEDYDLWLRIGCRYEIGLVDKKLVIKRGGHDDQLSSTVEALDKYRIIALKSLLLKEKLDFPKVCQVIETLKKKCFIYGEGCRKRGRIEEAQYYFKLPELLSELFFLTSDKTSLNVPPSNFAK